MSWLDGFALLSLAYIVIGIGYLYRFIRRWRSLWDAELTVEDAQLAAGASFFLLIPPTVALHELGHAAAIHAFGLRVLGWVFYGYMGAVAHHPTAAGDFGNFVIALAGNVVTLLIGAGAIAFGMLCPGHPVRNILALELGRLSCFLVLVFYPALCIVFDGDFVRIYDFTRTPVASSVTAGVHALVLGLGWWWWSRRGRARAKLLCSPHARAFIEAERTLVRAPDDAVARERLGVLWASVRDFVRARAMFEPIALRLDPRRRVLWAEVLLETNDADRAVQEVDLAAKSLLRPEDRAAAEALRRRATGT